MNYTLRKHHRLYDQIRPLINPLLDVFGIPHFHYFFVSQEGHWACLSSHPAWLEHYFHNELFLHSPFIKDPKFIPEGVFFTKSIRDPHYLKTKKHAKTFGMKESMILTSKKDGKLHGFSFGLNTNDKNYNLFVNELPLLKRFCFEFQQSAEKTLQELASDPIDMSVLVGDSFYKKQEGEFILGKENRGIFLDQLKVKAPALLKREKECLLLYLSGETAKSIADTLELSHRTVESYLEATKYKLNCHQKTDLLKKAQELQDYGLLVP